jgi:hypothetical protein
MTCPSCGQTVVPQVPVGTVLPDTGCQMTYMDFRQLLGSRNERVAIDGVKDPSGEVVSGRSPRTNASQDLVFTRLR